MKTSKVLYVLSTFLLLAVCLTGICSAAVSVNNVNQNVGPQAILTATVTDITAETYQWYTCDDANGTNPVAIEGATSSTYTTNYLDAAGTTYYKVEVNGTESAVATVTATMPTDYHVFKVNSVDDVKTYVGSSNVPTVAEFVDVDGIYAMQYNKTASDKPTNFPISYINNLYLQAYPYLVFSLNYDSLTSTPSNFQIRSYTDRSINGNFHFQPTKSGFVKYVVNTATSKYVGYDKSGKQVISGNTYDASNNKGKWNGKFTQFRLDFDVPAAIAGEPIQFEYMGFFPTEEMAKAYAGEMPLDTESEKILAPFENAETSLDRDEYPTQESIAAYVAELVAQADAAVEDVKAGGITNVTYEIENVTYTEGTDYNCYSFTVDVLVGDTSFKRSRIRREYKIFTIGDVTVADKTVTVGPDATISSAFEGDDTLDYQWYICDDAEGTNPVAIEGATKASYTFHVDKAGTAYYKLVVNGVIESNVATFTATMPTEPIVLKFNNTYDTAKWSTNLGYTKYLGVPVYKRAHAKNTNDDTTTISNIASYNIYLAAYPVIVIKAAYPEFPANNVDIYVGTDRDGAAPALQTGATTFQVPVGEGFMTLVFDCSTGTYKSYKADGSVHTYTTKNFGSVDAAREGKLDYLRLDLSNGVNNYQKNYYFEYIGFFPTLEMANAYTGAMPADEYSNVVISAFEDAKADDTFVMDYDEAMTEEKAEAYARELYDSISAAAVAEVKEAGINTVDVTFTAGEYTPYTIGEKFAQNGSYTFKVSVLAGDTPLQRSYLETEVEVLLMGNQPNVFLEDLTVAAGPKVTLTPEIIPGLEATSFRWYTCDANGENAVAIEGATSESYTLYPLAGTRYYMVTVNGNENSNVMALTGTLATEPVVLRFNSEQDLANWRLNGGSDKAVTTYEGKKVFTYIPGNDGSTFFDNLSEYNDFYLQSYPYFVISANYPDYAANATVDIYIGADGYDAEYRKNHYDFNFSVSGSKPAVNHGYTKTIINATTRKYKSYNANGTLICEGTGDYGFLGADTLVGKLATLRVDFSNSNAGKPCYIEYLGFFPTEEMALAYTSAMPNDADLNTIVSNVKNSITVPFAASETEATASAGVAKYAKKAIDAAAAALNKGYDSAEATVSNGVYSRPTKFGAGTYTADIDVVLGDKPFGRSQASFNTTVTLNAKPESVIMAFDTAEKVNAASISGHLESKALVEENGRKFMRLVTTGSGDNYLEYTNFYTQTGSTFNFQDYPYMKMSYRRNIDRSNGDTTSEGSQIYIANRAKYYLYFPGSNSAAPYWEQLTMDMRTNVFNYYRENTGETGRYLAGITVTNPTVLWEDQVATGNDAFHFRLTRYGTSKRTLDYEYIAFFASEEEARVYPKTISWLDVETLSAANTFNAGEDVLTEELAEAAAAEYIGTFDFVTDYTIDIENAVYTASTKDVAGTYVFDVWFGADKKAEYTVTVTMTLPIIPFDPVAKIGDVGYETFMEAFEAVQDEETITLLADITLSQRLDIAEKSITINLGGKTITSEVDDVFGSIYVKKGATLTITGEGTITSEGITIGTYGTVNIEGGNIVTNGEDDTALYVFYYTVGYQGTATISGGSLNCIWNCGTLTVSGGTVEYLDNSSELTVTGGTIAEIYAQDGSDADGEYLITITDPAAITVPDGFELVEVEAGKYQVVEIGNVAVVDGVEYATLQEAFASIPANATATVKLIGNVTIEGTADGVIVIDNNKNVTLDLNGHTITATDNATGNFSLFFIGGPTDGEFTVMDSAEGGKIELTSANNRGFNALSGIFHNRGGIITVESGSYIHNGGTDMAWVIDNSANSYGDAVTTVNGGTLISSYTAIRNRMEAYGANGNGNGIAVLNVNGGSINGTTSAIWGQASSSNANQPAKGEITVTGGDIGTINVARNATSDATTTISGGTVANIKAKAGEVKITNGTLTGDLTILDAEGNTVANDSIITGGTFYSDLSAYVANGYEIVENGDGTYGVDVIMLADGDINGDGNFNVSDIIFTMQSLASSDEFDETQMAAADVTGDGAVDVSDVIRMLQYLALK